MKRIRKHFGFKDNRVYDPLPLETKECVICKKEIKVADGTTAKYHSCCRKFRNNKFDAFDHIKKYHA